MRLRFTKPWGAYNSGECAGFDEKAAAKLQALGVAVVDGMVDKAPVTKAVAAKPKATKPKTKRGAKKS